MQVYRPNLCDVNALKQKAKAWNQQSLTVSAPCTRVINSLLVWRSSAARAVKRPNSHKPFPLTNLLHDLSTRGLQTKWFTILTVIRIRMPNYWKKLKKAIRKGKKKKRKKVHLNMWTAQNFTNSQTPGVQPPFCTLDWISTITKCDVHKASRAFWFVHHLFATTFVRLFWKAA